jgi:nitrogen fixation NifU-like protein
VTSGERSGAAGNLTGLYREAIRRHAAHPVGYRVPIEATHRHEEYNPLCGDRVEVRLRVAGDAVEAAAFDGEACAICMASASLLCSLAPGRTVTGLRQLNDSLQKALDAPVGAASAANDEEPRVGAASAANIPESRLKPLLQQHELPVIPQELHPLLGVRPYPSRIRCATLPWTAAVSALGG